MAKKSNDASANEVSVSVGVTPTSFKAKFRSRLVSAIDRLMGIKVDAAGIEQERHLAIERARVAADIKLIEAIGKAEVKVIDASAKALIERAGVDPEFAMRALENDYFKKLRRQQNKDDVIVEAIEHLEAAPVNDESVGADNGPEQLSEEFLDRFEPYAEFATTEQLKKRWGRVLAEEVRAPGTFNAKALRVVDELEQKTASLFEALCKHRIENVLPKALTSELSFTDTSALVMAGLLFDPGLGQQVNMIETGGTNRVIMGQIGDFMLVVPPDFEKPKKFEKGAALMKGGPANIAIPVFVLTDVGVAIASILTSDQEAAFRSLAQKVVGALPGATGAMYRRDKLGRAVSLGMVQ